MADVTPAKLLAEHDWFEYRPRLTCCRKCGLVKRADGTNKPCKGWGRLRELEATRPLTTPGSELIEKIRKEPGNV
jgi:hypothetical protein